MNRKTATTATTVDRHAAFVRVGERHVTAALKAIKRIENLGKPRYEHSDEELKRIVVALENAVAEMSASFEPKEESPKFKF